MRWLDGLNIALVGACSVALLVLGFVWMKGPSGVSDPIIPIQKRLPEPPFRQPQEKYDAIGEPFLSLQLKPAVIQLPDLRKHLVYQGRNQRPDVDPSETVLHFGLRGSDDARSAMPGERIYLNYERENGRGKYRFTEESIETQLWIEVRPSEGQEALVRVGMRDVQGNLVDEPKQFAELQLKPSKVAGVGAPKWSIGDLRVDASLLARMRARWYGQDRFLEQHGGDEFGFAQGKERIDFGDSDTAYAVFVSEGDILVWTGDRWQARELGAETRGVPLMQVKKINGKLMNFELWDAAGRAKVSLNLIRSRSTGINARAFKRIRFLGTKTRTQAILEIDKERVILNRDDWLLQTKEGWLKLDSIEQIDSFVERRLKGDLFVYDGIGRKESHQVLTGHVFNSTRTEMQRVELSVSAGDSAPEVTLTPDEGGATEDEEEPAPPRKSPIREIPDSPEQMQEEDALSLRKLRIRPKLEVQEQGTNQ